MRWEARVLVRLKAGVLDPQGAATRSALESLGFSGVEEVRVGKLVELAFQAPNREEAELRLAQMCHKLLANPVIEVFEYALDAGREGSGCGLA